MYLNDLLSALDKNEHICAMSRIYKGMRSACWGVATTRWPLHWLASAGASPSVDISARRLAVAADRARILDLSVRFVQADVTDLSVLADDSFGLVYTGGHVSVWVADIQQY